MRRWLKRFVGAGVAAGALYAIWRVLDARSRASELTWTAQPFPSPPKPAIRDVPAPWVDPDRDACPATHPVKAKLKSAIYHQPGGQMYDRTTPDRCYRDAEAATADGLRASKR